MTYSHMRADCLYTGISSGPNAQLRVWEAFFSLCVSVIRGSNLVNICASVAVIVG